MGSTSVDILHGRCWTTLNGPTDTVFVLDCSTWTLRMQSLAEPYTSLDGSMQRLSRHTNEVNPDVKTEE